VAIDTSSELWKLTKERIGTEQEIWLTTTSADGTPQPNPVWFIDEGQDLIVLSKPNQAKLGNIGRNPRSSVNFETSAHVQILTGSARVETSGSLSPATWQRYVEKYAPGMSSINVTPEQFAAEYSAIIRFTPENLRGW